MRLKGYKRKLLKNELDDIQFIFENLQEKPTIIFDCGANIGFVTHQFQRRFKDSEIYAFEPNPLVFETLKTSYSTYKHIHTFNYGISDSNNHLQFYKNNNTGTSSFLKPNEFHKANLARSYEIVPIPVVSIGDFCNEKNISHISILKLDIEGFELNALKGCIDLLRTQKIDIIYTEVNFVPTYENQPLIEDIIAFLRIYSYVPFNFYGNLETKLKSSIITNILFISNEVSKSLNQKAGLNTVFQY